MFRRQFKFMQKKPSAKEGKVLSKIFWLKKKGGKPV